MTRTSGTADEILNLPSGGGSVSGAGDTFSVDLNTGAAAARIELQLPAGPNGLMPPFNLGYSTGVGDGPFGMGWSLDLLTIRRKVTPSSAAPDADAVGLYALVGAGALASVGGGRYRPTVDASGLLIEFTDGSWTATDRNDTVSTLGTTANARIGDDAPAAWLIDRCADSSGNAITYVWLEDGAARLPASISWGTYQLLFNYESRPDILIDGTFGAPVTTSMRCNRIELHVTTEAQSLVRDWTLLYAANVGRSLLETVREAGHGADGSVMTAPDRTFRYSDLGAPALLPVVGWTSSLTDIDTDLVDLTGDGLPDVLRLGGGLPTMAANLGGGRFAPPRPISRAPAPLRLSAGSAAFADMEGNGAADLLVLGEPLSGYYPLTAPGGSRPPQFGAPVTFTRAPRVSPGDPRARLLDLDGDGVTDILFDTGRGWLMYLREGLAGWSDAPRVLAAELTPPVFLTDPHVYLADMTGDGLTDIVRIDGGGVTYWPARADGGWGAAVAMSPAPAFDRDHDPARLALVDLDGDGCADLIYVGPGSVRVWRNIGANRLAAPIIFNATPPARPGSYRVVDLLGAGVPGIIFQLPPLRPGQSRHSFLDLSGGVKPFLLTDATHGPCESVRITYRPSTAFASDDAAADTPWRTYHPFAFQCVAMTERTDLGSGVTATTRYAYHDGRYDPATRTFLGFGRVDCDSMGDATCPTLRVETEFHLGLDPADPTRPLYGDEAVRLGALRRKPLKTTTLGLDGSALAGKPYSITLHTYDALLQPSGLGDGVQVAVPYPTSSVEQRWERQDTMVSSRTVTYLAVNEAGDVTSQRTIAQRTGQAAADQDITTTTTFATGGKNLRLPARVTQTLADGTVVAVSVTYYDGPDFVGLPEGQAAGGLVTRIEDLAFTDTLAASVWGAGAPDFTSLGYHRMPGDAAGWWKTRRAHQRSTAPGGTVLVTKGPLGAAQTLQFDAAGQRVLAVTDAAGNKATATSDPRVCQTRTLTDANSRTTSDVFDVLGRVTATIGPLDTPEAPGATFDYALGAVSTIAGAARIDHGGAQTLESLAWVDGSGRLLGKATPAVTAGNWIVGRAADRNGRGLVTRAWLPYEIRGQAWTPAPDGTGSTQYVYDALGRILQATRPDGLAISTRREGDVLVTSETWPAGAPTDIERQTYDAAGQLIAVARNARDHWVEQTYAYAPSGKIATVGLPTGLTVTLTTDLLGRLFAHDSPDSGRTVYWLDAGDNPRRRDNAAGQSVITQFDAMNRPVAVFHDAETTPRVRNEYFDAGGPAPADGITANRCARLWRVTDEIGTVVFEYDEAGRTTASRRTVAATGQVFTNLATYDALGRAASITLPAPDGGDDGRIVQYAYGPDGRLSGAGGIVETVDYDIFGRTTAIAYANGAKTQLSYFPNAGSLERVQVTDSAGAILRDTTITRADGLVRSLASAAAGDDDAAISYDGLRRMIGASYGQGAAPETHAWSFDDAYRPTSASDAGAITYRPGTHQLASVAGVAVAFDAAGRLASGRQGHFTFDAADHLSQVVTPGGQTLTHLYDWRGHRSASSTDGTQTYLRPIENIEFQAGAPVIWIPFGRARVAAEIAGELWFQHANALGGMDLITDAAGHEAGRLRQTPFGLARPGGAPASAPAVLLLLMTGADATGLICQGCRWYDPTLAQFISPDPMVTGIYIVGAWNPYLYCLGNPIALFDPTGASFASIMEIIGIAVLAAACVVGAIFTGGATLVALGVIASNIGGWLLVGVAVGSLGGALAGELAAQKSGGNLWAGAFIGALLGGATSLAGGALGGAAAAGVDSLMGGTKTLLSFVAAGAIQGAIAGAGTGLATGYAGGKGSAEGAWIAMGKGAAWGAALGALLGAGVGAIVGGPKPDQYMNIGAFAQKFFDSSSTGNIINSVDNIDGAGLSALELAAPGGFSGGNVAGLLPNLLTTGPTEAGWFSIPIGWLAPAVLADAGIAGSVDASMAMDQAGFSYAHQLSMLIGAAPYFIDFAFAVWQFMDKGSYDSAEVSLNHTFGSASPDDTG